MTTRAPSTRVDAEELQATKSEKLLAVVLAVFLLIGSIWIYAKTADWIDESRQPTAAQQKVLDFRDTAWNAAAKASAELESARTEFDVAKANLDVAAQDGTAPPALKVAYQSAQQELTEAQAAETRARSVAATADKAASTVEENLYGQDRSTGEAWAIALLRLTFIVAWLLGSLAMLGRLRRTRPRYLPLGMASVGVGAVMAVVFAIDYITDYIDPLDLGPIVLSAVGAIATIVAFVVLQRWLSSRIPGRRVRKGECPYCGYPVRHGGSHCEGCGRETIASCAACNGDRRVGSLHCVACGAA